MVDFFRLFAKANIELKIGINRKRYALNISDSSEGAITYANQWIELKITIANMEKRTIYSLSIRNLSINHIRISRLSFPVPDGIEMFLKTQNLRKISFLRNGFQSWSTARSYRAFEKPLRPRFKLISLATSNMANLPSNIPGMLSSEMYSVITDLHSMDSMLVGQLPPFNQFFYIVLNIGSRGKGSFLELIYDFGRQLLEPGKIERLDGIIFLQGSSPEIEHEYFREIEISTAYKPPAENLHGWCSWYQYYNRITPEILYRNLKAISRSGIKLQLFQIDDGYEKAVGDWLNQTASFDGRMKELARVIKESGMKPGIWLAPFTASEKSDLFNIYPEYILKNESGKFIKAGYNPIWKSFYYGLDITHPKYAEYLEEVIDTFVNRWGFEYLKCDFLFTASLHGAIHHELSLSSASILKLGMKIIRDAAGPDTWITGSGMPISPGIGFVDSMRVGPDTGDFWIHYSAGLLRSGSMVGVRNSIRNFMVRSPMQKHLWLNDPDCIMIRDKGTGLSLAERLAQMDAIALSGGILLYSDDFSTLSEQALADMSLIEDVSEKCFSGRAIAIDVMEQEIPEIYFNTAGYLGLFNFYGYSKKRIYDLSRLKKYMDSPLVLIDLRNNERIRVSDKTLVSDILHRGSRLFKLERENITV